jgi:hypothetical protein
MVFFPEEQLINVKDIPIAKKITILLIEEFTFCLI